jgi:hypothetical protein
MASEKDTPSSNQDSPWKEILDAHLQECMEFFYPEIAKQIDWSYGYQSLDKELQSITTQALLGKRIADKLFQVKSLSGEEGFVLLHCEIQGKKELDFPLRLFQYYYRFFDQRKKPILTLVILTDMNKSWRPREYQASVWKRPILNFKFDMVKLLDYRERKEELLASRNPFAIAVLTHIGFMESRKKPQQRADIKFALTRRLYELYESYEPEYRRRYVSLFLKMIDWILVLPKDLALTYSEKVYQLEEEKKMSYITSFERIAREKGMKCGIEQGIKQGIEKGIEKGRTETLRRITNNLLAAGISPDIVKKVIELSNLELTELEA